MTGTEINYPPSRTYRLEGTLEDVQEEIATLDEEIADLEDAADVDEQALAEKRVRRSNRADQRDALQWAISEFGADAELTIEAFSTAKRSRTLDTANRQTMGQLGNNQLTDWLLAAAITEAPWLEGGEDLRERYELVGALPPALTDYLDRQQEALNDLSEGN